MDRRVDAKPGDQPRVYFALISVVINVRFGSSTNIGALPHHVRSSPESRHRTASGPRPLCRHSRPRLRRTV